MQMPLAQSLAELPKSYDRGAKTNAKGYQETWNGYKLHIDVTEHGVPVSCILTSASLHDNQVAILLETMTAKRITHCYSLMDKGYCSESISFCAFTTETGLFSSAAIATEKLPHLFRTACSAR